MWPAEAETLPQAERETIMAKLWDTLTRKLPWNSREFFVASAKAMVQELGKIAVATACYAAAPLFLRGAGAICEYLCAY